MGICNAHRYKLNPLPFHVHNIAIGIVRRWPRKSMNKCGQHETKTIYDGHCWSVWSANRKFNGPLEKWAMRVITWHHVEIDILPLQSLLDRMRLSIQLSARARITFGPRMHTKKRPYEFCNVRHRFCISNTTRNGTQGKYWTKENRILIRKCK